MMESNQEEKFKISDQNFLFFRLAFTKEVA